MKHTRYILILILILFSAHTAYADELGYIIQADVNDERLVCVPEENIISENLGYYYVETEEELAEFCESYDVITYAEDGYAELFDVPDDAGYSKRWDAQQLNLPHVWDYEVDLSDVTVAIIDSGLNYGHEDINYDNVVYTYSVHDGGSDVTDYAGHGTSVAGIIGAVRDNGVGTYGVAHGVNMMMFKVMNEDNQIPFSYITKALVHIYDNNLDVDVINMSLGGRDPDNSNKVTATDREIALWQPIIDALTERGIIVVAAVGNEGAKDSYAEYNYPAACDNVIGVGSVSTGFVYSPFSQRNDSVYITAPGGSLYTTKNDGTYTTQNGTSFSSPYVAAIAAFVKAIDKDIDYEGFSELIKETALDKGDAGYDVRYGWGVIQPSLIMDQLAEEFGVMYKDASAVGEVSAGEGIVIKKCAREYTLYAAEYNADGAVERVHMIDVESGEGEELAELELSGADVRLFVWDEDMVPLAKV